MPFIEVGMNPVPLFKQMYVVSHGLTPIIFGMGRMLNKKRKEKSGGLLVLVVTGDKRLVGELALGKKSMRRISDEISVNSWA